jgi:hypothetical protein
MSTTLFEAFDAAFATPARARRPSHVGWLLRRLHDVVLRLEEGRRRRKAARVAMNLPQHLLKDIGYVTWDGRLWERSDWERLGPGGCG